MAIVSGVLAHVIAVRSPFVRSVVHSHRLALSRRVPKRLGPHTRRTDMANAQGDAAASAPGHVIPEAWLDFKGYRPPWPVGNRIVALNGTPTR